MTAEIMQITALVFLAAYGLTGVVRRYALRRGILDVPNARSSHVVATPRGGGLAIVVVFLGTVILLALRSIINGEVAAAICGGGLLVAGVGWLDDRRGLPATLRAGAHVIAASWALYWLGGLPSLNLGVTRLSLGSVGFVLGVVGIVWFVNLYNFMDGIDGLAGTEAITVAGTAALLIGGMRVGLLPNPGMTRTAPGAASIALVSTLLVPASAGFLVWNWPPARIFMGDVGSGFLGFTFGVLAVASENSGALPLLVWVLLLGVFVVDATATLLRRIWRRERWTEAHRTHAYQLAVQAGHTHKQVTVAVLGINIALAAAAAAACVWPRSLVAVIGICGTALVVLRAKIIKAYELRHRSHTDTEMPLVNL
ncbi:MAG: glycosyltransferase family 4 protein [Firmicutes bacterium]|nr:glycosyltransferase family 4 protein [Bacillota bacterium]MDH7496237.1 glycosyltransferase family 4 protein [Bacillota bacterium]